MSGTASEQPAPRASGARFAALRDRYARPYLFSAGLSMLGDNNEHVITYWVLWQRFHSPALVGFEVVSHWLPYLLLSVWFGSLAERHDCRRLIQLAQGLFMFVSAMWGVLFLTGTLQVWEACVLLVLHGTAGAIWAPAEQLMLHDFVDRPNLAGAVRLNATFRSLGVLFGPAVGSALLLGLGPIWGIFVNLVFYLPMTVLMLRTPYTGHTREGDTVGERVTLVQSVRVLGRLRSQRLLMAMILIAGLLAVTVGGAMQVVMPVFATRLGAGTAGLAYGALLFANGAGGVVGGFLLEATGVLRPSLATAIWSTVAMGVTTLLFALSGSYALALIMLVVGGVANMASMSITQSIVQLEAPPGIRGRVYGVYSMFASGLRVGNGLTLGVIGAAVGVPGSLAACAGILIVGVLVVGVYARRRTGLGVR